MQQRLTVPPTLKRALVITGLVIVVIAVMLLTASFWVNWWWYGSIGYRDSLTTRYRSEIVYTVLGGLSAAVVFGANLALAMRRTRDRTAAGAVTRLATRLLTALLVAGTAIIAVLFGLSIGNRWEMWQLARFVPDYGQKDPVFNRDISFYLLRLPALSALLNTLIVLVFLTLVATVIVYIVRSSIRWARLGEAPREFRVHVLALAGVLVILIGLRYVLVNYQLVYSTRGSTFGASFTDVNVQRWTNYALVAVSLFVGGWLLVNAFTQRVKPLLVAVAAWVIISALLGVLVPSIVQAVFVEPSELRREREYIANNIAMSREGFGLADVSEREISGQATLESGTIQAYPETLDNIRLWDYRIIRTTYQQLQSFVPYYVFLDVDIDRYQNGDNLQQVLISAREFEGSGLPAGAQTWTNTHLVYTHGYGAVVSPVSEATAQGLPIFLVERIPPSADPPYEITRPEIYFGEAGGTWVAVNSNQPEFSGEISFKPGADSGYVYDGQARGSVDVGTFLGKLLLSVHLRDQNLFYTDEINDDTRVLLKQRIQDRVLEIAPFLTLDPDPYLVISEGRFFWIIDAYMTSDRFPHATRIDGINYIRNSVKVVVDAYNGNVDFYRTPVADPVADAFDRTYGDIFKPIDEIPADLAMHFRYPELLFEIQSGAYTDYHVTEPTAFYNGEDRWAVPQEQLSTSTSQMVPYYVTLTLPGESDPEYALIRPFIPGGTTERQNMTAWMAGIADEQGNSELVAYRFPRQDTVFGPSQISARIDQEPDISSQISLWNQSGSEVIRGNLLVIPVGESVLYVQPLYLQARGSSGSLPEMKRVIVASSERVVMRPTLEEALIALTAASPDGAPIEEPAEPAPAVTSGDETLADLADQAVEAFQRSQQALQDGDWTAYGEAQAELEALLTKMAGYQDDTPPPVATPEASG